MSERRQGAKKREVLESRKPMGEERVRSVVKHMNRVYVYVYAGDGYMVSSVCGFGRIVGKKKKRGKKKEERRLRKEVRKKNRERGEEAI